MNENLAAWERRKDDLFSIDSFVCECPVHCETVVDCIIMSPLGIVMRCGCLYKCVPGGKWEYVRDFRRNGNTGNDEPS